MKLIKSGSVKNIWQQDDQTLCFQFSDRYSIFDWGEMPDLISGKGRSLAIITTEIFNYLENSKNWKAMRSFIK